MSEEPSLITCYWMYGPQRERPCPMCTSALGGVNGNAVDIKQRAALKILRRNPVERQMIFAAERGWHSLNFVQTVGDDYACDLGVLTPEGDEYPTLVVIGKTATGFAHSARRRCRFEVADPGQDPRTAPDIAPLWNLLDLTPEGRGQDWYPKLSY